MRPEWAVMRRSIPAASAAAVKRRAMARAVSGTTRSLVSGCVSARSVRRAVATPSLTYRRSVVSPVGFVFEVRTRTRTPEVGASASVRSDQRRAATSDRRNPAIKSNPAITASSRPRRAAAGWCLDATPGCSRPVARGKDGRQVVGGKGVGAASAAIGGGAPETCEDAAGRVSGRVRVVGQAGAKPGGGDGEGGDARAPAGVVDDGQIGGEGRVVRGTTCRARRRTGGGRGCSCRGCSD